MSWPHKAIIWCFRLLLVLVAVVFLPNTSELFEFNKLIIAYIFSILIAFFWLSRCVVEGKLIFKKTILDLPILAFLASQFISLLFSIDPRTSLMGYYSRFNGGFLSLVCYAIFYWAAVTHLDAKSTKSTIAYSLVASALVSFYGVLEHLGIDKSIWVQDVQTRVFSSLGQPNWLAAYIDALIFIPLSMLLNSQYSIINNQANTKNQNLKIGKFENYSVFGYWLLVILLFITLLFTKSRSGIAAFGISSLVFWAFIFKEQKFKLFKNYIFIGFWVMAIAFGLLIPTPFRDQLFQSNQPSTSTLQPSSSSTLESGGTESGEIRKIVWQGAFDMWKASPKNWWIGTGTDTFAQGYYQHRPLAHNNTSEWELLYNKAHNEYLNYLATTGTLGLGTYLLLLAVMLIVLARSCRFRVISYQPNSEKNKFENSLSTGNCQLITLALFAGWLTIPLTNFWGFSVVIIQILMFLLPAFAIILNQPVATPTHKFSAMTKSQLWFILIFFASPALVLLYFVGRYWLADTHYASGQKDLRAFAMAQDPTYLYSSYQEYLEAYQLNDADSPISSDLSIVTAYLALLAHDQQPQLSTQLESSAIAAGLRAVSLSPYHPNYYKSLSRTYIILSSLDEKFLASSDQVLASAQHISPTDPRLPFNRGVIAQYQNQYDKAKQFYTEALRLKPDFGEAKAALSAVATMSAAPAQK